MITREQFLEALADECTIAKHLYSKLPEDGLDYRITPGQRSTEELLRYLSACGIAAMDHMVTGNGENYRKYMAESVEAPIEEFPERMDLQLERMTELFNSISDEDLVSKEVALPTGQMVPIGYGLVRTVLAWLTAYRMQLFLQVKASGVPEINTANNWAGRDWKRPEADAETEATSEEPVEDAAA